jgi:hypothetical protein
VAEKVPNLWKLLGFERLPQSFAMAPAPLDTGTPP